MESFHLHSVMQRLVAHENPDPGLGATTTFAEFITDAIVTAAGG